MAALDPMNAYGADQAAKYEWYREPVYEPRVFFPNDLYTAKQIRWRTVTVTGQPANVEVVNFINVDIPSVAYAITGSAFETTGAGLPVGAGRRSVFLARYAHNSGDRLTPVAQLAENVCGTAQFPALIGAAGWVFNRGGSMEVGLTPLLANLRIDLTVWFVEIRSRQNYNPPG
jgi:hypothetical protein